MYNGSDFKQMFSMSTSRSLCIVPTINFEFYFTLLIEGKNRHMKHKTSVLISWFVKAGHLIAWWSMNVTVLRYSLLFALAIVRVCSKDMHPFFSLLKS